MSEDKKKLSDVTYAQSAVKLCQKLLFDDQLFDFWFPDEENKDKNPLEAIYDVKDVEHQRFLDCI
jgi:hypothetical protein